MLDVTASDTGLTAVGRQCPTTDLGQFVGSSGMCRPLVWTSATGETWTRIDPKVAGHPGDVTSIAAVAGMVVAVGGSTGDAPARYTLRSTDGVTWQWAEVSGLPRLDAITATGGGFAASSHDAGHVDVWTSVDGRAWRTVPDLPAMAGDASVRATDLVASDDRLVVVGWRETHDEPDASGFALVGPLGP